MPILRFVDRATLGTSVLNALQFILLCDNQRSTINLSTSGIIEDFICERCFEQIIFWNGTTKEP